MKKNNPYRLWLGVISMLCLSNAIATDEVKPESDKALVTGDYLRVRDKPSLKGSYTGVLFKNMLIKVLARSKSKMKVSKKKGAKAHYWYRVEHEQIKGWCYGKFLTFTIPAQVPDTYYAKPDMNWFYKRFGDNTFYTYGKLKVTSFTMDQYRQLITASEKGDQEAWRVLHVVIYPHLKQNPNDKAYQYLKKKLYNREYILQAYKSSPYVEGSFKNLPDVLLKDETFYLDLYKVKHMRWALQYYPGKKAKVPDDQKQ